MGRPPLDVGKPVRDPVEWKPGGLDGLNSLTFPQSKMSVVVVTQVQPRDIHEEEANSLLPAGKRKDQAPERTRKVVQEDRENGDPAWLGQLCEMAPYCDQRRSYRWFDLQRQEMTAIEHQDRRKIYGFAENPSLSGSP